MYAAGWGRILTGCRPFLLWPHSHHGLVRGAWCMVRGAGCLAAAWLTLDRAARWEHKTPSLLSVLWIPFALGAIAVFHAQIYTLHQRVTTATTSAFHGNG